MRRLGSLLVALLVLAGSAGASAEASVTTVVASHGYPTPTVEPKGSRARPGMPAVTKHATTFSKAPKIAPGTGKASKKLLVRDQIAGHGEKLGSQGTVEVRYVGVLYSNGKVFDSSWARGPETASFGLDQVIPGFAGGLVGVKVGGRREIVIPPRMGYGRQKLPGIPPNSTLVFVVDLVRVS